MYTVRPPSCRSPEIVRRSALWPRVDGKTLDTVRLRLMALEDVLCRLPPDPYGLLSETPLRFQWHVDDGHRLGQVRPRMCCLTILNRVRPVVVQLAEALEQSPWPIAVTVVAHELAHVVLRHAPATDPRARQDQEIETWNAIRHWGFAAEADVAEFLLAHDARAGA